MNPYPLWTISDIIGTMLGFFQRPQPRYVLSVNTVRLRRRCREIGIKNVPRVTLVHRPGDDAGWWSREGIVINALGLIPKKVHITRDEDRFLQDVANFIFLHELRHAWQNEHRPGWFFQDFTWPIKSVGCMMGLWGLIIPSLHQGTINVGSITGGALLGGLNFLATTLFLDYCDTLFIYPHRRCEQDAWNFAEDNIDGEKWKGIIHLQRVS